MYSIVAALRVKKQNTFVYFSFAKSTVNMMAVRSACAKQERVLELNGGILLFVVVIVNE